MVEKLLGLLAQNVGAASWLIIYFAGIIAVFVILFAIVTLAAIFGSVNGL